jgi:hypothetical protein
MAAKYEQRDNVKLLKNIYLRLERKIKKGKKGKIK